MNPFYNPVFLSKVLKSYVFDIKRLERLNNEELKKYQDKQIQKIVRFAFTVPLYHDKYKKASIYPNDIRGLKDIKKLPYISKEDIKSFYPDGIISSKTKKEKLIEISTSGTTGKTLSLYVDMFDIVIGLFGYLRTFREYGINWRKNRITIIGDFAPHTAETGYIKKGLTTRSNLISKNIQWLNTNDEPKKIINDMDQFKPEFIGGYTGMLGHLALLKEKGLGKNVTPKYIASTGAVLDKSLKEFIEKTFNTQVFEAYGATETGPIAFQCKNGKIHVMSDLVYLEFLKNGEPVPSSEPGKLVVTKLYGRGTPIIRYNAVNDIVAPLHEECNCGLSGGLIEKIYGRDDLSLIFSEGRILLPSTISNIYSKILYELKSNKVKDTKIIQHSLTELEIQILIDEKIKDEKPSTEEILSLIKKGFYKKIGSNVDIIIKEVKKLDKKGPRIVSKVDRTKIKITQFI
jgi:phenylacetate-CoA ligase